eukprot:537847_1
MLEKMFIQMHSDREQIYNLNIDPLQQLNEINNTSLLIIICNFKFKMINYINNIACPIDSCQIPDTSNCISPTISPTILTISPTKTPSKYPTLEPTLQPSQSPTITDTTCNTIIEWDNRISNVINIPTSEEIQSFVLNAVSDFVIHRTNARMNPDCVTDSNYNYMYYTTYQANKDRVQYVVVIIIIILLQ